MRMSASPARLTDAARVNLPSSLALCLVLFLTGLVHAQTLTLLYSFQGGNDGLNPVGNLLFGPDGNLYGATKYGGGYSYGGTAYKLSSHEKEAILYDFLAGYGAYPIAGLVSDERGMLYGTTGHGGAYGLGTVFEVDSSGNEEVLHSFAGGRDGNLPEALIRDETGNLYGISYGGGIPSCNDDYGCGTIFEISQTGKTRILHAFNGGSDGLYPVGVLARDEHASLYGAATYAGANGCGTFFKLDSAGQFTVLHAFTGTGGDGCMPEGGVVIDGAGNLYGTTWYGGSAGVGTVYKVDTSGRLTVLHSFLGPPGDGDGAQATLTLDSHGTIYGTTGYGGRSGNCYEGCGIVFMLDSSGKETVLHNFTGPPGDGSEPAGGVVLDSAGSLYGATMTGGDGSACGIGCGVIFKLTP
jgi:uncharacterized repeat protein (TIGR03803 family)